MKIICQSCGYKGNLSRFRDNTPVGILVFGQYRCPKCGADDAVRLHSVRKRKKVKGRKPKKHKPKKVSKPKTWEEMVERARETMVLGPAKILPSDRTRTCRLTKDMTWRAMRKTRQLATDARRRSIRVDEDDDTSRPLSDVLDEKYREMSKVLTNVDEGCNSLLKRRKS